MIQTLSARRLLVALLPALAVVAAPSTAAPAGAADAASGWVTRPPLHHPRFGLDVSTADGQIYAVGGFAGEETFDHVEVRQTGGPGTWRDAASLRLARTNLATATLNGTVYAIGGIADSGTVASVETLDPRQGVWRPGPALPEPRDSAGAAVLDGVLYVAGGFTVRPGAEGTTASAIAYDLRTRIWRPIAPMPAAREKLRLVAVGRYLYALGGFSPDLVAVPTVARYDPATNTWRTVEPMRQARAVPGATVTQVSGRQVLVVVGGASGRFGAVTPQSSTEVYQPETGRWRTLRAMLPEPRASLGAATESDGTVLAIGGGSGAPTTQVLALRITGADLTG